MILKYSKITIKGTEEEQRLTQEALRILKEYVMHKDGVTYQQQGYLTVDGQVWACKIDEHLLVDGFYKEAQRRSKKTPAVPHRPTMHRR